MSRVTGWIDIHKDKIIAILALLVSFFTALLSMGGKVAIFSTVMIAIVELAIFYLKNGLTEKFLDLCVSTVKLIVDVINGEYTKTKTITVDEDVKGASKKKRVKVCLLTEDMIRDILLKKEECNDESEEV